MPRYYFDTSAILKRYYREAGTTWVHAISEPRTHPVLYLSQVTDVEVVAALYRVGRLANKNPSYIEAVVNLFERHRRLHQYQTIACTSPVTRLATALCRKYWSVAPGPLRSLDAIQLASARSLKPLLTDELLFVTADARMEAIGASEGLSVANPMHPPRP